MNPFVRPRLAALAAATIGLLALAACHGAPVSPLSGAPASPSATANPSPSAVAPSTAPGTTAVQPPTVRKTTPPPVQPSSTLPSACLGRVVYTVDGADSADIPPILCIEVGGKLRIRGIYPEISASPSGLAICAWEGGVADCTFTNPGNVTITAKSGGPRVYHVLVVK